MQTSDTHATPREDAEAHWPDGVQGISFDQIGRLGVGRDNSLYWDGKAIVTRRSVVLTFSQRLGAIAVAIATVITAGAACVTAYAAIMSLHARQVQTTAIPAENPPRTNAPRCPQGRINCEPWERAWNSDTIISPRQTVTDDGRIIDQSKR